MNPGENRSVEQKPAEKPFSVLYAEDELAMRILVTEILSRRYPEIRIDTADNGAAGFNLFKKSHYDLVITDNMMPHMSGSRMVSEIWAINPGIPVIFLSACLIECDIQDIPIYGVYHFLQKPFRFSELFGMIDKYITPQKRLLPS